MNTDQSLAEAWFRGYDAFGLPWGDGPGSYSWWCHSLAHFAPPRDLTEQEQAEFRAGWEMCEQDYEEYQKWLFGR